MFVSRFCVCVWTAVRHGQCSIGWVPHVFSFSARHPCTGIFFNIKWPETLIQYSTWGIRVLDVKPLKIRLENAGPSVSLSLHLSLSISLSLIISRVCGQEKACVPEYVLHIHLFMHYLLLCVRPKHIYYVPNILLRCALDVHITIGNPQNKCIHAYTFKLYSPPCEFATSEHD